MLDEDPIVIVYELLRNNWDASNTALADPPMFNTGWYDRTAETPQVTVTNSEEGVWQGGNTGHSAASGDGGVTQYRMGSIQVNCWGGSYDTLAGMGDDGSDVSPKEACYDMAGEVHRITQENATGTTKDDGSKQLHTMSATDTQRVVETEKDPSVFRYQVIVEYGYAEKTSPD